MKKIPLHVQIIIALIVGAFFGSFFSIDTNKLEIDYKKNNQEKSTIIKDWSDLEIYYNEITTSFGKDDQSKIVRLFEKIKNENNVSIRFISRDREIKIKNVTNISKPSTPATVIKPIGDIFIRLLSFLAIPLVIASLVVGAASLGDVKKLGRIGLKTFALYMATTAIAITIGLVVANIIQPGNKLSSQAKSKLLSADLSTSTPTDITKNLDVDIVDFFVDIVPKNPFQAISSGNMLQIVFFAVFFGIVLTFIEESKRNVIVTFFDASSDTLIKMVDFVMKIAPYGVFALISATVADFGFSILSTLFWYIFAVLLGLLLHLCLIYIPIIKFWCKFSVREFFKGMQNAQAIAFSTSSSAATLPVTMECVEVNLKVPKKISGFVLPLGATINMDGTALYQGVAAVFIAQVYGINLGITEQLTIVLTAVLASIGTAPVPGVGIIMLVMILQSVHIPPEGIALIIGVDRLLDMARTINNITGDAIVALAVSKNEN